MALGNMKVTVTPQAEEYLEAVCRLLGNRDGA